MYLEYIFSQKFNLNEPKNVVYTVTHQNNARIYYSNNEKTEIILMRC